MFLSKIMIAFLCLGCLVLSASQITLIVPANAPEVDKTAAQELTEHLTAATGEKFAIANEEQNIDGRKIYLGNTGFSRKNGVDFNQFGHEEYLLKAVGNDLIIGGGAPRGTLYGVYEFLERFTGVTWLDEWTTHIPAVSGIKWPQDLNLRDKPVFAYRGIYSVRSTDRETRIRFRVRCRENIYWDEKITPAEAAKWGITPVLGRPSPLNTLYYYIKDWPKDGFEDCLSMNPDGSRIRPTSFAGPGQVCFSSRKARDKFIAQLKGFIAADRREYPDNYPQLYNLSINDTQDRCHCPDCRKLAEKYQAYSGTMLEFVNAVADGISSEYQDVRLQTSAYLFTEEPPVGIKPALNVTVRVSPSPWGSKCETMLPLNNPKNRPTLDNLRKWSELGSIQIWNYWVIFGPYPGKNAGLVNIPAMLENLKIFHQYKSDYVFSECEFPDTVSFHPLRLYLGYKMKWNPDRSVEPILDRYFTGYYREAALPMRQLYDYMVKRQSESPVLDVPDSSGRKYLDADFFRFAESRFSEAEKLANGNPVILSHITQERVPLDIARLSCRDNWPEEPFLPAPEKIMDRLKTAWPQSVDRWYEGPVWQRREQAIMKTFFQKMTPVQTGAKYPLTDPRLTGRRLYDIAWPDFNAVEELGKHGVRLVDDPAAVGGKAMRLAKPVAVPEKGFHEQAFRCGVQSRSGGKLLFDIYLKNIPDENYHLYHLGRMTLDPNTLLWIHNSWFIQQHFDRYYRATGNNTYDVYASIKLEGPAYVKGSTKTNAVYVDRILLSE